MASQKHGYARGLMNIYQKLRKLTDELFRRKTGIKRKTFERMVEILREAEEKKKEFGGKPNKLSIDMFPSNSKMLVVCL